MIGENFECARPECGAVGVKATHNQKYCSNECCRIETNRKIMEKYHERVAIKKGKKRQCSEDGCSTLLSRYNHTGTCGACESKNATMDRSSAEDLVASVTWL